MSEQPRVLLIEDDAAFRKTLRQGLEKFNFSVIELDSGVGAENVVADNRVDVVVCDLFMPEREGVETILALRGRNPALPVVAMTGSCFEQIAERVGATHTLMKPFALSELARTIMESVRLTV